MRKLILVLITTLLFSSCTVTKTAMIGEFKGIEGSMGGLMTLSLNSNQSFDLNWRRTDYTGNWEMIEKNNIILKFDEITDLSILLSSGKILDSVQYGRFVNKNKLKMDGNITLKRQK